MKHVTSLLILLLMISFCGSVQARRSESSNRGMSRTGGRGGGSANGITGTIASVGTRGFVLTLKDDTKLKIAVDRNTKFTLDGNPASPDDVTEGITVAVLGGMTASDQMLATELKIKSAGAGSKKKK